MLASLQGLGVVFTEQIQCQLEGVVGEGGVVTSLAVREHHGQDESYHACLPPDAVVFPRSVEEVVVDDGAVKLLYFKMVPLDLA